MRPDIILELDDGRIVAVVEVRNRENLTCDVATAIRRNMINNHILQDVKHFLIVSQDMGYLWIKVEIGKVNDQPSVEFNMVSVITRYLGQLSPGQRVREQQFEMLIATWLRDIADANFDPNSEPELTLSKVGFTDDVRFAAVVQQVAYDRIY